MVSFGGWEMPLQYSGITEEHLAVRRAAGLFDVSHMGEIEVAGSNALAAVQRISTNDAARLEVGQAQYSALATPEGTFVDDLLVYRLAVSTSCWWSTQPTSRRTSPGFGTVSRGWATRSR